MRVNNITRDILLETIIAGVFVFLLYLVAVLYVGHRPGTPELLLIAAVLVISFLHFRSIYQVHPYDPNEQRDSIMDEELAVDAWEMQRQLMKASDQPLPDYPVLSDGGLLYGALVMEETGETFCALAGAIEETHEQRKAAYPDMNLDGIHFIHQTFMQQGLDLITCSKAIRASLENLSFSSELPEDAAIELFDGTTDITVVNCGLALALGLPGSAGYDEVARSNLSKINPHTGKIDKTADGKWIKGVRFFKPNLQRVLFDHAPPRPHPTDEAFKKPGTSDNFDPNFYPHTPL